MPETKDDGRVWRWLVLAVVAIPILLVGGCFALLSSGGDSEWRPTAGEARRICEDFVKDRLKSPSTAKFSGVDAAPGSSGSAFTVAGAVDSQNSFGATVRADFRCQVHYAEDEDRWRLDDLDLDQR